MPKNPNYSLALYEKAMPSGLGFGRMLECAAQTGFDRLEISIDESDARLARLDWTCEQKQELVGQIRQSGVPIRTMCLSGHRKYPFGAHNAAVRARSLEIMKKAVDFAAEVGVSVIQLAGYDVYYEPGDTQTRAWFAESLQKAVGLAAAAGVVLAFETMETPFMDTVAKSMEYVRMINSPWLGVYPDIGNLSAWDNDVQMELQAGIGHIVAVHVKDTKPGVFKNVPFGEGVVDFERCFETLKQSGYCGPYLIEMWSETAEDPAAEVAKARDWVKARMAKAGMVEAA